MRGLLASPLGLLIGLSLGALGGGGSILAGPRLVEGAGGKRDFRVDGRGTVGGQAGDGGARDSPSIPAGGWPWCTTC